MTVNRNQGFTLVEVLSALVIGSLLLGLSFAMTQANKALLDVNRASTSSNQNVRAILDLVGDDIRTAGERLQDGRPLLPLELQDNVLTIRRRLDASVLPLCFYTTLEIGGACICCTRYQLHCAPSRL